VRGGISASCSLYLRDVENGENRWEGCLCYNEWICPGSRTVLRNLVPAKSWTNGACEHGLQSSCLVTRLCTVIFFFHATVENIPKKSSCSGWCISCNSSPRAAAVQREKNISLNTDVEVVGSQIALSYGTVPSTRREWSDSPFQNRGVSMHATSL
jgi:hypothetical protein